VDRLGRYQLIRKIGTGGMAEVFLASLEGVEGFKRDLVVKRMKPTLVDSSEAVKMFLDEARLQAKLHHPNLVQVFDLGEADGTYFIAMEFVDGMHLGRLARRAWKAGDRPPLVMCAYIVHRAAEGLHFAHEQRDPETGKALEVVHRDISPHNILLSRFGDVKVADFGVAKAFGQTSETQSGVVKGKVSYMSPEQVLGKSVDRRSDIFSLGIVLFEICTGRRLFKAKTDLLTLQRITEDRVPVPSKIDDRIDAVLDGIILRCLAQDPDERYQTMAQLEAALGAWLDENAPPSHQKTELGHLVDRYAEPIKIPTGEIDAESPHDAQTAVQSAPSISADGEPVHDAATMIERPSRQFDVKTGDAVEPTQRGSRSRTPYPGDSQSGISLDTRQYGALKTNLTPHGSRFIGRGDDLAALHRIFQQGAQLITVHGPGGTGKTRLALRYAERHLPGLSADGGGAWFCDLSLAESGEGIAGAIANALGVPLTGEDPILDVSRALVGRGRTLVILDNFEQVALFAPDTVARLMGYCREVRFLVTSREILHVPGEVCYELNPMGLPERGKRVESCESVQLFLDRAKAARADFVLTEADVPVVAEIVERLDGIPLAIELAAARVKVLRPRKLLERLNRRFDILRGDSRALSPRQATLRATIDWSWNLLEPVEMQALMQCAIFRGGFNLEAAEEVIDLSEHDDAPWVLDVLQALRDKSLLRARDSELEEMRFDMYESVREYASEKLQRSEHIEDAASRHARFFLDAGEQWAEDSHKHDGKLALTRLLLEKKNLLAAHARVATKPAPAWALGDEALRAIVALEPLYDARGPRVEQIQQLDEALKNASDGVSPILRARALAGRGRALRRLGRIAESRTDFAQALKLTREADDVLEEGRVLRDLGVLASDEGRLEDALRNYEDAIELHKSCSARYDEGITLAYIGFHHDEHAQNEKAAEIYQRSLEILRDVGDKQLEGLVLGNWASSLQELGQYDKAVERYEEAIALLQEADRPTFIGPFLGALGTCLHETGRLEDALKRYDEAFKLMRETGNLRYLGLFMGFQAGALAELGDIEDAEAALDEAEELHNQMGDPRHLENARLQRGFVELARARALHEAGDADGARQWEERVEARVADAQKRGPDGEAAPAESSDDVRRTLSLLRRLKNGLR
jgi:predicted ATPase/serine/threonine protein kinase